MAKKKATKKVPKAVSALRDALQGNELGNYTGSVARNLTARLRAHTGDRFITNMGEARALMCGIPVPSLAFEYLIRMNILPLGKLIILVGIEKVGKSGLLFEMVRWFRKLHGFGVLLEHESKFSPEWASSIIGWDEPDALIHVPCDSIEGWQTQLTRLTEWAHYEMEGDPKKDPRPGKVWPLLIGIDSLMGKSTEGVQQGIREVGHSSRHWADEARSIADYMRYIPQQISRWPIILVGVNHLKPSKDPVTMAPVRQIAGGRSPFFQQSLELELGWGARGRKASQIRMEGRDGMQLRITCENSSYGVAHTRIFVTVWSWQEEYEGLDGLEWRPRVVWDWHGATTTTLLELCTSGPKYQAKMIKDVVNIQKVPNRSLYYAKQLGITKEDPQPADVLGMMIYEDKEMLRALRKILKIRAYQEFVPGVDLDDQLEQCKRRIAEEYRHAKTIAKPAQGDTGKAATPQKKAKTPRKKATRKKAAQKEAASTNDKGGTEQTSTTEDEA